MKKTGYQLFFIVFTSLHSLFAQHAGTLDTTFNSTGFLTTSLGTANAFSTGMAIQPDGKIILSGYASNGNNNDFSLIRYHEDGSLDTDFNMTGKLQIDFNDADDFVEGIVVRPQDHKIIVGGYSFNGDGFDFAVAQYLPDGTPDPSFGNNGKVTTPVGETSFCKDIALQEDGKIVLAGFSFQNSNEFTLIRYLEDGSLDESFNDDGIVTTPFGTNAASATCILIQTDEKILVAGQVLNEATFRWESAIARYKADGSPDNKFGVDGQTTTPNGNKDLFINDIATDADGNIIITGFTGTSPSNNNMILIRYLPDGRPDSLFGTDGILTIPFTVQNNQANTVLVQSDRKIVVAGMATINDEDQFAIARFNDDGTPDVTFGSLGKVTTDIGNFEAINTLAFDTQGRIVVSGASFNGTNFQFAAARYLNDLQTGYFDYPVIDRRVSVYPNPIHESFQLDFKQEREETLTIELVDMQGRILETYADRRKMVRGNHSYAYTLPSSISTGVYFIRLVSPSGTSTVAVGSQN